jgi:Kef-type K+ transport system membrane component KefB
MTLGAFLGGMMVAESPFKASVRSEIGPFRGLLVSFFFLSVGASLDRRRYASRNSPSANTIMSPIIRATTITATTMARRMERRTRIPH